MKIVKTDKWDVVDDSVHVPLNDSVKVATYVNISWDDLVGMIESVLVSTNLETHIDIKYFEITKTGIEARLECE